MNKTHLLQIAVGCVALLVAAMRAPLMEASPSLAPASDYVTSCTGEYFNNMTLAGSPVLVRSDAAINFLWPEYTSPGVGVNVSNYSVRWTCSVNVPTTGTYTFTMVADDGMNLLVDGHLLIWAWHDQGPSSYSKPIYLSAGWHTVRVEYYNNTLGGTAQVYSNITSAAIYNPLSGAWIYPPTYVSLSSWTGEYFNNTTLSGSPALVRTDQAINFYWPQGTSPGPGINVQNYSVRWTRVLNAAVSRGYTFSTVANDRLNLQVDGKFLIQASRNQSPTAYSNSMYLNAGAHTIRAEYHNHTPGGTARVAVH